MAVLITRSGAEPHTKTIVQLLQRLKRFSYENNPLFHRSVASCNQLNNGETNETDLEQNVT